MAGHLVDQALALAPLAVRFPDVRFLPVFAGLPHLLLEWIEQEPVSSYRLSHARLPELTRATCLDGPADSEGVVLVLV